MISLQNKYVHNLGSTVNRTVLFRETVFILSKLVSSREETSPLPLSITDEDSCNLTKSSVVTKMVPTTVTVDIQAGVNSVRVRHTDSGRSEECKIYRRYIDSGRSEECKIYRS